MYPKQFNAFFDGQGESFFAATMQRLKPDAGFEFPIILCNNDHRFLVREDLERTGIEPKAVILEPVAQYGGGGCGGRTRCICRES